MESYRWSIEMSGVSSKTYKEDKTKSHVYSGKDMRHLPLSISDWLNRIYRQLALRAKERCC